VTDEAEILRDGGDEPEEPVSLRTRVGQVAIAAAILLLLGLAYLHVAIPPAPAGRPAPAGHLPGPCWVCHMVSRS
jgi:hypothetical protein